MGELADSAIEARLYVDALTPHLPLFLQDSGSGYNYYAVDGWGGPLEFDDDGTNFTVTSDGLLGTADAVDGSQ